jgi:LysM repeat protein
VQPKVFQFAAYRQDGLNTGMRWRVIALLSLGVNVLIAASWLLIRTPTHVGTTAGVNSPAHWENATRTNVLVRRQILTWREIESDDWTTYVANLRAIGCPEQTIRDIIIADVNAVYAKRQASEVETADQQWWRSEPDRGLMQAAAETARNLEEERRALLSRLLGVTWESGDIISLPRPTRQPVVLDGPVLGSLPSETKQAIQEVNQHSQERMQAYLEGLAREGKNPEPAEMARLRRQTREDLARVLPAAQLEEYLLRYSQNANNLRATFGDLTFTPTRDEFREVFKATDTIDQQLEGLTGNDPNSQRARRALEQQREEAIKVALGPKRYEEYRELHDPLYRQAVATAQAAGTPEAARDLYAGELLAANEQLRIQNDANLTADQKNIEAKRTELDQLRANALLTGQDLPPEPPPVPAPPPRRTYTVGPGDSAAVVSMIHGVPVAVLRQANPNVNLDRLRPGDSLVIPPSAPPPGAVP